MSSENSKLSRIAIQRYFSANPKPILGINEYQKTESANGSKNKNKNKNEKDITHYNIAILGDGVDYNHPAIINKTIYSISKNGNIIGAGFDFIGQDPWAAPYIAKTSDLDPDSPFYYLNDSSDNPINSKKIIGQETEIIDLFSRYENMAKNIADFNQLSIQNNSSEKNNLLLDPNRNLLSEELEYKNSFIGLHGTTVAGILLGETSHLKVLPIRISPINPIYQSKKIIPQTFQQEFILQNIIDSIEYAAKENVSLIYIPIEKLDHHIYSDSNAKETGTNHKKGRQSELMEQIKKSINTHSNIFFAIYAEDPTICLKELDSKNSKNSICVSEKKNNTNMGMALQPLIKSKMITPTQQCLELENIFTINRDKEEGNILKEMESCLDQKSNLAKKESSLESSLFSLHFIKEVIIKLSIENHLKKDFLGINIQSKKQRSLKKFNSKLAILHTLKSSSKISFDHFKYRDQLEIY